MWYYGRLCSIYCSHDIWELCCQEQVNFDFVCRSWETNVLSLSPRRCLKCPRRHESEHDISAVCATVCRKDPEAKRRRVSKFGRFPSLWFGIEPELHDLATYFSPHYLSKLMVWAWKKSWKCGILLPSFRHSAVFLPKWTHIFKIQVSSRLFRCTFTVKVHVLLHDVKPIIDAADFFKTPWISMSVSASKNKYQS